MLRSGSKGTQACINAASTVSGIIGDLDTTIMFASAGTLSADGQEIFSDHRSVRCVNLAYSRSKEVFFPSDPFSLFHQFKFKFILLFLDITRFINLFFCRYRNIIFIHLKFEFAYIVTKSGTYHSQTIYFVDITCQILFQREYFEDS